jgi:ribonucleoside-diphosphate reductase alpha chain
VANESEGSDEDTEAQLETYSQSVSMTTTHKAPTEADVKFGAGAASARTIDDGSVHSSAELLEKFQGKAADAPMCMTCGTKMRPAGSCYVCEGCGSTSGCS